MRYEISRSSIKAVHVQIGGDEILIATFRRNGNIYSKKASENADHGRAKGTADNERNRRLRTQSQQVCKYLQSVKRGLSMKFNEQEKALIETGKAKHAATYDPLKKLVTVKEVAARLGVTVRTTRKIYAADNHGIHRVKRRGQYHFLPEVADAICSAWKRGER